MKISQANGVTRGKTLSSPHVAYAGKEAREVTLIACCLTYLLSQSCDFPLCFVVGAQALPRPLGSPELSYLFLLILYQSSGPRGSEDTECDF